MGFCPSGLLSQWAFVQWACVLVGFCLHFSSVCPPERGGGGTLIFHTYVGLGHFWVKNFEFQYFYGVFRKLNNFGGMKILWIFFWFITNLDYIKRPFLFILGSFLKVKERNGEYFWGC